MSTTAFRYKIDSARQNSNIKPQTFTVSLEDAQQAVKQHSCELPGCCTKVIDLKTGLQIFIGKEP